MSNCLANGGHKGNNAGLQSEDRMPRICAGDEAGANVW
jgi:hypothetical protein